MNRSTLATAVFVTAASLVLAGCGALGGAMSSSGGEVTLKLVAADYGDSPASSSRGYWDDVIRRFEAQNPDIKVDVRVVGWNDIDREVKNMVKRGDVPDLLETGGYAQQVADGQLYKASEVLSVRTWSGFIPGFTRAGEVHGVQYGIPFVSSARAFFYNKSIFEKAGIERPPRSWAELRADAARIKERVPGVTPYALPLGSEEAQGESLLWEFGNGGSFTGSSGAYTLNSPQNVATFGWLKANLVNSGLTYADPASVDRKKAFADFAAGRTAMLNGHPSLIGMAKSGRIDYGVAPVPGKEGALDSTLGVADWMMAFKKNGHRKQIRTFLDFVYAKENTLAFDERYDLMPVTEDTLEEMTSSGRHKELKPFFALLPDASFYPLGDPSWDAVSAEIKQGIGAAVTGDPGKVLDALQAKAEATPTG